ncbi:MAG TPA: non-canonical purine NTP pyrophosphatase [Bdellovibrionota bacterium]|jgi:inosine/xanthosine triphosphate pyrophosphatase family protein|nr:non-canonical purine NTP pyrophosphatase [Bdellovibrionota bacterium]
MWKVNTSNRDKLREFEKYLGSVSSQTTDLDEPDADLITVIQYKASQFDQVVVDDTSLEIDGVEAGVNIKWLLAELPSLIGRRASFTCLLGIARNSQVEVFRGEVAGTIVSARGDSFGFNNHFLPTGRLKTFGEEIPADLNPRKIAVDRLLSGEAWKTLPLLKTWDGKFQG